MSRASITTRWVGREYLSRNLSDSKVEKGRNTKHLFQLEPFHEHVFLEHHIEEWCPTAGPVRHFMEVVCVGLQKNPYITVEKKLSHLEWFKNYFNNSEKMEILKISGAIDN